MNTAQNAINRLDALGVGMIRFTLTTAPDLTAKSATISAMFSLVLFAAICARFMTIASAIIPIPIFEAQLALLGDA